jgi:hypothetical protein
MRRGRGAARADREGWCCCRAHAGILGGKPEAAASTLLEMPSGDCYVTCEASGLLGLCARLGERIGTGQVIARVHSVERLGSTMRGAGWPRVASSVQHLAMLVLPKHKKVPSVLGKLRRNAAVPAREGGGYC